MGRHSASYIAAQQALSTGTTTGSAARYVGRVGGLALALGLGAAVAGGAGLAHAEGTTDPGVTKPEGGTTNDVESSTDSKTRKPGLFHNVPKMALGASGSSLTGHAPDPGALPGLISKIPQQLAGLVADRTTGASGASTSPTAGGTAPQVSSRGSTRHRADFSKPGPTTGDVTNVVKFRATVDDVVTALHTGSQSLGVVPSTPDPIPQERLNVSSLTATNPGPVTSFAGPTPGLAAPAGSVVTVVSGLLASFGGSSSGSGNTPVAPAPILAGALQLIRRETSTPTLTHAPIFTSISALLHPTPGPAPVVDPPPTTQSTADTAPLPGDFAVTDYGNIGKWMLESNGQVSDYGGQPYQGDTLVEPVNVIIVDPNSKSAAESTAKVNTVMTLGGFPPQPVHSSGFLGLIGGKTYSQQPGGLINAYSDNLFVLQNDHGRLFGPAPLPDANGNNVADDGYVYSGAFSTETPTIYNGLPAHAYVSSNMARDALVLRLLATGQVESVTYVPMENAYNENGTTTGDHDGYAVVIVLK